MPDPCPTPGCACSPFNHASSPGLALKQKSYDLSKAVSRLQSATTVWCKTYDFLVLEGKLLQKKD